MKQKQKRSSRNASLKQLLEQYVLSCVKKIVTTTSLTGEEVKAEDVVFSSSKRPEE